MINQNINDHIKNAVKEYFSPLKKYPRRILGVSFAAAVVVYSMEYCKEIEENHSEGTQQDHAVEQKFQRTP